MFAKPHPGSGLWPPSQRMIDRAGPPTPEMARKWGFDASAECLQEACKIIRTALAGMYHRVPEGAILPTHQRMCAQLAHALENARTKDDWLEVLQMKAALVKKAKGNLLQ
mgnify:CR=1 FL=1